MSETATWLEDNLIMPTARTANWVLEDFPSISRGLNSWQNFVQENKNELSETIDEYSEEAKNAFENKLIIPAAITINALLEEHPAVTRWLYRYQHTCNTFINDSPENILTFATDALKLPLQVATGLITLLLSINCQSFEIQKQSLEGFDIHIIDNATEGFIEIRTDRATQQETLVHDAAEIAHSDEASIDLKNLDHEYFIDMIEEIDTVPEEDIASPNLKLEPEIIEFGTWGIGCTASAKTTCIKNDSSNLVTISEINPNFCSDAFAFAGLPATPFILDAGAFTCFDITYSPIISGNDSCQVNIFSHDKSGHAACVNLQGSGTLSSENVDMFDVNSPYMETYKLSAKADGTGNKIRVAIDIGKGFTECMSGWLYDNDTNSIIFINDDVCIIEQGCKIRVWYELECKPATDTNVHITIVPQAISFSQTTIGCDSKPITACALNDGGTPITLLGISLWPELAEFQLTNIPALPVVILAGAQKCFSASYTPFNDGIDEAEIIFETDKIGNFSIPVIGDGTWKTENTEYFISAHGNTETYLMTNNADPTAIKVWIDNGSGYQQCLSGWIYDSQNNSLLVTGDETCLKSAGANIKIWYKLLCLTS